MAGVSGKKHTEEGSRPQNSRPHGMWTNTNTVSSRKTGMFRLALEEAHKSLGVGRGRLGYKHERKAGPVSFSPGRW